MENGQIGRKAGKGRGKYRACESHEATEAVAKKGCRMLSLDHAQGSKWINVFQGQCVKAL